MDSYRGAGPPGVEQPRPIFISADDAGAVVVWGCNTSEEFSKLFAVQLTAPVSAVAARGDQVIAAEISGMVSFISLTSQQLYCKLRAHSRYLSAMDMHPTRDVFATVSEVGGTPMITNDTLATLKSYPYSTLTVPHPCLTPWFNGILRCGKQ